MMQYVSAHPQSANHSLIQEKGKPGQLLKKGGMDIHNMSAIEMVG